MDQYRTLITTSLQNLSRNQQRIRLTIAAAAILTSVYFAYAKFLKMPKAFQDIPRVSSFQYFKAGLCGESSYAVSKAATLDIASKSQSGIYVRFGMFGWNIHVVRHDVVKQVMQNPADFARRELNMSCGGTLIGQFMFGPNVLTLDGHRWKMQKKVLNPAFRQALPVHIFGELAVKIVQAVEEIADQGPVHSLNLSQRFALDALGLSLFGFDFQAIKYPSNEWVGTYRNIRKAMFHFFFILCPVFDRLPFVSFFPQRHHSHAELKKLLDKLEEVICARRGSLLKRQGQGANEGGKDLLTLILEASIDENNDITNEELKSNITLFFTAGHDTTAIAISNLIYHLAVNSDVQAKARQEVLELLGDTGKDVAPTVEQTRNMTYINMVILESLRITPPAGMLFPRQSTRDTEINGIVIPKGTAVTVDVYELHHNPSVWKNPHIFDPERFAPGGEAQTLSAEGQPWMPFGGGIRQCLGMKMSLEEQRVLISMLLKKFDMTLPKGSIHENGLITEGIGLVIPKNLEVSFKRRY